MARNVPLTLEDAHKLREAAKWFDAVDALIDVLVIEDAQEHTRQALRERMGGGNQREIQDYLITVARKIEQEH